MQQDEINVTTKAIDSYNIEKDIACNIKKEFNRKQYKTGKPIQASPQRYKTRIQTLLYSWKYMIYLELILKPSIILLGIALSE